MFSFFSKSKSVVSSLGLFGAAVIAPASFGSNFNLLVSDLIGSLQTKYVQEKDIGRNAYSSAIKENICYKAFAGTYKGMENSLSSSLELAYYAQSPAIYVEAYAFDYSSATALANQACESLKDHMALPQCLTSYNHVERVKNCRESGHKVVLRVHGDEGSKLLNAEYFLNAK